ncbi:hypothetical protein C5S31_12245 [ANME-1 cluster archaeon GoMg2]|nr:hypothetical protein [ANME-1 cluster archaeon GoMg2]
MKKLIAFGIVAILLAGLTGVVMARCVWTEEEPIMLSDVTFILRPAVDGDGNPLYDADDVTKVVLVKLNDEKLDKKARIRGKNLEVVENENANVLKFDIKRHKLAKQVDQLGIGLPSNVSFTFKVVVVDGEGKGKYFDHAHDIPVA